ncbi:MAG TPA: DsbA family protein [Solirubrobacterales bacterium]|nr:DsbA family protein [Solirubrobacterales bacterium]
MDATLTPPLEEADHLRGEPGRPLELVMFGDFQCPFCLGAQSVLRRVHERLGERLVFAFRHLPIPERHPLAPMAAEASEAAAAQGKFWEYHDALFAVQPKLSRETALEVGRELGLDAERMAAELDVGTHRERVERDLRSAERSGATGTPAFFTNGARLYGAYDASSLVEALEGGTATN